MLLNEEFQQEIMNPLEIEEALLTLSKKSFQAKNFPYAFFEALGHKRAKIKTSRGFGNISNTKYGLLLPNNLHMLVAATGEVAKTLQHLRLAPDTRKYKCKIIISTDGEELAAENILSGEIVACQFTDFPDHSDFFLPLAGISTIEDTTNNPIDIEAARKLRLLYSELLKYNENWKNNRRRHYLNQLIARLIFCFFAEDVGIFYKKKIFTRTIERLSCRKPEETRHALLTFFQALYLSSADRKKKGLPEWTYDYPKVRGTLFAEECDVPNFSEYARRHLIFAGNLNWKKINPDIFGSMIQSLAEQKERGSVGLHYTSVPNILKVLNPLFLDDLRQELDSAGNNISQLVRLKQRISKITVFDPSCGSGNFLVIAYKKIRAIEYEVNKRLDETHSKSVILLSNFRGIELLSFVSEIARLALVIAKYQCDKRYIVQKSVFSDSISFGTENWVVTGNALQMNWFSICPPRWKKIKNKGEDLLHKSRDWPESYVHSLEGETFICGNPPFAGHLRKTKSQRDDMALILPKYIKHYNQLDYVAAFFVKTLQYLSQTSVQCAYVATSSITQGRQVPVLWPVLETFGVEIRFAHRPFLWTNNVANYASVFVVVIGIAKKSKQKKFIFEQNKKIAVRRINGYLTAGANVLVEKRKTPISPNLEVMHSGNMPLDGGNLILTETEAADLLAAYPSSKKFLKPIVGAREINQGLRRFCLWIRDADVEEARSIPPIASRIISCRNFRLQSSAAGLANTPHAFRDRHRETEYSILLPNLSSERRNYRIPIIAPKGTVATNLALAIYDGEIFQYSILASRMHHVWVMAVCGKLKQDFRYSNTMGWHTFPLPRLSDRQKLELSESARTLIMVIESYSPLSLNELYNSYELDKKLKICHEKNDELVEKIYVDQQFNNDSERLERLFDLYSKMRKIECENDKML